MVITKPTSPGGSFKPHPEGIHPAVLVGVIDQHKHQTEYQGRQKSVQKLRLVFETEAPTDDGRRCTVSKSFTASLHEKSRLFEFVSKWFGRPPTGDLDLNALKGKCCTLVISHQEGQSGKIYANIDAVSKPTKKLEPSGSYDEAAEQERYDEWYKKNVPTGHFVATPAPQAKPAPKPAPAPAVVDNSDDVPF